MISVTRTRVAGRRNEAGLLVRELVGIEGLTGWVPHLDQFWQTEDGRPAILKAARAIETEPALLGLSAHLS
jgi:hypothetical protein